MTVEVRAAIAADYEAYARLFGELGIDDPVPSRERFASDLARRIIVATAGGDVVGYLLFEILDDTGYVRNVVSDPAHRRGGVGVALMSVARERFVRAGATGWCLNVKADNVAALRLYEKCGMGPRYRSTVLRLPREIVLSRDPTLALVHVPPETDAVVETAFRLLPGQLASARKKPARMVVQLVRRDDILGVGVFVPTIPGAFPWKLAAPEHAATFLALLREHAPDEAPFLQIVAEDDEALAARVLELGAYVRIEMLHMSGALV